jgi:probable rRNA maturation factor
MILLDPDLETHPLPRSSSVKRAAVQRAAGQTLKVKTFNLKIPAARTLARFLKLAQEAAGLRGQVTVLLTTDAAVKDLNRRFRGKNKATDVLSFPAEMAGPVRIAGDLAISVDTARRQAAAQGHGLGTELKVLILHGLLHLAGYDHETDEGRMARRERVLRGRLGLPQGLIERVETGFKTGHVEDRRSPTLSPKRRRKDGAPKVVAGSKRGKSRTADGGRV